MVRVPWAEAVEEVREVADHVVGLEGADGEVACEPRELSAAVGGPTDGRQP